MAASGTLQMKERRSLHSSQKNKKVRWREQAGKRQETLSSHMQLTGAGNPISPTFTITMATWVRILPCGSCVTQGSFIHLAELHIPQRGRKPHPLQKHRFWDHFENSDLRTFVGTPQ